MSVYNHQILQATVWLSQHASYDVDNNMAQNQNSFKARTINTIVNFILQIAMFWHIFIILWHLINMWLQSSAVVSQSLPAGALPLCHHMASPPVGAPPSWLLYWSVTAELCRRFLVSASRSIATLSPYGIATSRSTPINTFVLVCDFRALASYHSLRQQEHRLFVTIWHRHQ